MLLQCTKVPFVNILSVHVGLKKDVIGQLECKEVQIVYRLFLVNCYLLYVPRLPSQPASNVGGLVIH